MTQWFYFIHMWAVEWFYIHIGPVVQWLTVHGAIVATTALEGLLVCANDFANLGVILLLIVCLPCPQRYFLPRKTLGAITHHSWTLRSSDTHWRHRQRVLSQLGTKIFKNWLLISFTYRLCKRLYPCKLQKLKLHTQNCFRKFTATLTFDVIMSTAHSQVLCQPQLLMACPSPSV